MMPVSLLEFVRLLLSSDVERARFDADPDASLARHGLAQLSPGDVHEAVLLAGDTMTVDWSQAYGAGAAAASGAERSIATSAHWWTSAAHAPFADLADDRPAGPQPHLDPEPQAHPDPEPQALPDALHDVLPDAPDLHVGP